ncbi:MAG: cytochrome c [Trueperaceae bacterium]|jgi:mono/diheme cytochrome c family protein|nr:cytochrome c [Trueperaceae bacterium]
MSRPLRLLALALAATLVVSACGRNMYDQPKAETYEASPFFADGASSRPLPEGTISRERGAIDPVYLTGMGDGGFVSELPIEVSEDLLRRGQERYDIFCSVCHNYNGDGNGMIVQKGFVQPASFHEQRLLDSPAGYYYNAITNGFGRMYSYASRIPVEDRWAIVAYVRALQLSQNATLDDVPAEILEELDAATGEVR